jgi:hypothetical protein
VIDTLSTVLSLLRRSESSGNSYNLTLFPTFEGSHLVDLWLDTGLADVDNGTIVYQVRNVQS